MSAKDADVLLIPCSGIGKVHGLIGREAVLQAVDTLSEDVADTLCLALLVMGDDEALEAVRTRRCITVDGCPKLCAFKNVELGGGRIVGSVRVVDAVKSHKGIQPGTATNLTEGGWTIVADLASTLMDEVRKARAEGEKE